MNFSIASDFTSITISGDALEQYMSNSPVSGTLKLSVYTCSSSTPTVIDLSQDIASPKTINGTTGSYNYIVVPADLSMTSVISNGVYKFELVYADTTTYTDTAIVYVNKDVACRLVNYYATIKDLIDTKDCAENDYFMPYIFDDLLSRANTCDDFTFVNACCIYNTMITILDSTVNECGCRE